MGFFREVMGNLITLAKGGHFDVIAQGNNCHCIQGAGLAPQMVHAFGTDNTKIYTLEHLSTNGDINKLGQFEVGYYFLKHETLVRSVSNISIPDDKYVAVCNCYTQYGTGKTGNPNGGTVALDYDALKLILRKINYTFKTKHIGLPLIGCQLAGGDWNIVRKLIINELKDMDVTIVHFDDRHFPKN